MTRSPDIFVSYRHREPHATWVREILVPGLEADGYTVVVDVRDFTPAGVLTEEMERASEARLTVAVVDESYSDSGFVHFERLVASRLIAVMRDPVDGLVVPGAVETVDLVGRDDPEPVLAAVHRVVKRVFILESEDDEEWVEGVVIPALDSSGVSTEHNGDLQPGEAWSDAVTLRLERADRVVVVLSSAYLRRLHPRADDLVAYVEEKEDRLLSLPLRREADIAVPRRYKIQEVIDATRAELWDEALARLCAAVGVDLAPPSGPPPCPYPGMRSFTSLQDDVFVGRDDEIAEVLSGLRRQRFVAIIGPSACGKSSLALAGVGPHVAAHGLDGTDGWVVDTIRPGETPVRQLDAAVERWRQGRPSLGRGPAQPLLLMVDQLEEIYTGGGDGAAGFEARMADLLTDPDIHVVVTVRADFYPHLMSGQLWSLVSSCRVEVVPLRGEALREAIRAPARRNGVVVADGLVERLAAETEGQPGLLPFLQETLVTLWSGLRHRYLTLEAYDRITDPSGTSGVVQAIRRVADSAVGEIEARHRGGERIVRNTLVRLVQFGEGRPHTRRQLPVDKLRTAAPDRETFESVFDTLVERRLVTTDTDSEDVLVADLSHEAIIRGWPTLKRWIDERRSAEDVRRRLLDDAEAWARRAGDGSADAGLLHEIELEDAQRWLAGPEAADLGAEPVVERFVHASAAAANRGRRRRRRAVLGAFAVLLLVAVALAVSTVNARQAEREAEQASTERLALQLRASSAEIADNGLPLRALLVRTADRLDATPVSLVEMLATVERQRLITARVDAPKGEGFDALWADDEIVAVGAGRGEVDVWPMGDQGPDRTATRSFEIEGTPLAIARRPGTNMLAVGGGDGSPAEGGFAGSHGAAYIVDLSQPSLSARALPLTGGSPVSALAFTGGSLLVGRWDGTIAVVAVDEPETPVQRVLEIGSSPAGAPAACRDPDRSDDRKVRSIAVDQTGRWLVAGSNNCIVTVWDTGALDQPPQVLVGHSDKVRAAAFVPSTTTLLTAGDDRSIRRWDVQEATGPGIVLTAAADEQRVIALCVAPDGRSVITAGRDHAVRRWTLEGTTLTLEPLVFAAHSQTIRAVSCHSSGRFASLGADGLVMWDLERPPRSGRVVPVGAEVNGIAVRPGVAGDVAVAANDADRGTVVVERPSGDPGEIDLGTTFPFAIAYSRDGELVAVAGDQPAGPDSLAGVAVIYDADTLAEVARTAARPGQTMRAVAVLDASTYATGADGGLIQLSVDGVVREARTESGFGVRALAHTPTGELLVGDEFGALYCYDTADPDRPVGRIDLGRAITSIAVGGDGTVVAGTADGFVAAFIEALATDPAGAGPACDPSDWTRIDLGTSTETVTSVALLANGGLALIGTDGGTVELWDVSRRRQIGTLATAARDHPAVAAGSPDGSTIAVGADTFIELYQLDRDDLRRRLCDIADRELTADERAAFLPDPDTHAIARCSAEPS